MPVPIKFIGEFIENDEVKSHTWEIVSDAVPRKDETVMFDDLKSHRIYTVKKIMYWYLWKPHSCRYDLNVEIHMEQVSEHEDSSLRVVEHH